jgi:hypothetical protein
MGLGLGSGPPAAPAAVSPGNRGPRKEAELAGSAAGAVAG